MRRKATSEGRDAADAGSGAKDGREYEVGYGKPPRHSQWAKGTSGNYAGRPRKNKWPVGPSYSFNPYVESFFKEMCRPVLRRDDHNQLIQLSAFEDMVREMIAQARNGDHATGRFLVQEMKSAADRREKDMIMMASAVERYKAEWPGKVAEARRSLKPVPFPHPDHYKFSLERGVHEFTGPLDHEGAEAWEQTKEIMRGLEEEKKHAEACVKEDPSSDDAKALLRACIGNLKFWEAAIPPGWDWREKVDLKPFL